MGADGPRAGTPGAAVLAFYDALWANDEATIRALLAPNAKIDPAALRMTRSEAGALNHMADQLNMLLEPQVPTPPSGAAQRSRSRPYARVEGVWRPGRRARVLVADEAGAQQTVEVVWAGGSWKLLRLSGT